MFDTGLPYHRKSEQMPKILVTRRTFLVAADALRASGADVVIWEDSDSPSQEDLIKAVADVHGLYAHITNQVNAEVMDNAPNLKVGALSITSAFT